MRRGPNRDADARGKHPASKMGWTSGGNWGEAAWELRRGGRLHALSAAAPGAVVSGHEIGLLAQHMAMRDLMSANETSCRQTSKTFPSGVTPYEIAHQHGRRPGRRRHPERVLVESGDMP